MIRQHMEALGKNMDLYISTYENFNFLGDFNAGVEHSALKNFFNLYSLTSLINKPTCWKNISKLTFIDLILTNHSKFFETGAIWLYMVVTIMKTTFRKRKSKNSNLEKIEKFRDTLLEELSQVRINNDHDGFNNFLNICWNTLDRFAPRKKSTSGVIMYHVQVKHYVKSIQTRSFFWSVFSRIWTEYGEILRNSQYSVQMRENIDQNKLSIWTLFTQWNSQ